MGGSGGGNEGGKGAQVSTDRIHSGEKTSWKAQREVIRYSGQRGC